MSSAEQMGPSDTFAGWAHLLRYLMARYPLYQEVMPGDDFIRFGYPYKGKERPVFFIHTLRSTGTSWMRVGVRLKPPGPDLNALLRLGRLGPVGALTLARDYLCVTHNLPLRGARADQVEYVIEALCAAALQYKPSMKPLTPGDGALFQYLTED